MEEGTADEGKRDFVDFKRVVWHTAFYELCKKVEPMSHVGVTCNIPGIGKKIFYPYIGTLAADYEEQSVLYFNPYFLPTQPFTDVS